MNEVTTAKQSEIDNDSDSASLRVAIQGVPGAFHDIAARYFFNGKNIELEPCLSFGDLTEAVCEGTSANLGLMAIENSLAGSIMGNYMHLLDSGLQVTGEIYLRIKQNLMALPGQRIEDLTKVYSHPMAIAQCKRFFKAYPHIHLVESEDTALSAKQLRDENLPNTGAIASTLAAEMYGLELLAEGIETNQKNYTRFLVLQRHEEVSIAENAGKVSLCFSVSHEVGSLHRVLSVMAAYHLNLTKIQSMPIAGKQWEYFFFVDFVCNGQVQWEQGINALQPLTADLRVLGVYPEGKHVEL